MFRHSKISGSAITDFGECMVSPSLRVHRRSKYATASVKVLLFPRSSQTFLKDIIRHGVESKYIQYTIICLADFHIVKLVYSIPNCPDIPSVTSTPSAGYMTAHLYRRLLTRLSTPIATSILVSIFQSSLRSSNSSYSPNLHSFQE